MPVKTKNNSLPISTQFLGQIPAGLRDELLQFFGEIVVNYREQRWEPSELNGGKLCEAVYTVIRGNADGTYPARSSKPSNFVRACQALEQETHLPRSLRIQIPRMLIALYEVRNNRGVGHTGGDVNPNHMDAVAVLYMSKWIVAELVRSFHSVETEEATAIVDALVDREVPVIWKTGTNRRVLLQGLSLKEQLLLLLYGETNPIPEGDLLEWLERSRSASTFRRDVLRPAHRCRLVEYDEVTKTIELSPLGVAYVEDEIPLTIGGLR